MEIHAAKLEQLRQRMRAALQNVQVSNNRWVVRGSLWGFREADQLMGKHGENQRDLAHYVDDSYPILELVSGHLNAMLAHNEYSDDPSPKPLLGRMFFEDLDKATDGIISLIANLPIRYAFSIPLPANMFADFPPGVMIPITEKMVVRNAGGKRDRELPLDSGNPGLDAWVFNRTAFSLDTPERWEGAILEVQDEGFVTKGVSTSPVLRVMEATHAVIGLAMIFDLLVRKNQFVFLPSASYYVHLLHEDQAFAIDKGSLSNSAAALLSDLTGEFVPADELSRQLRQRRVVDFFWNLRAIFDDSTDGNRIQNAAKWYFDAEAAADPLLGFVQMMVVLEILFGDKELSDKIGLGELLRNRCAYAIGQGAADREAIIRDFKEIYDVRSAIVHRGKNRLSAKERALFKTLSGFCRRAVFHEAQMLKKDFQSRAAVEEQAEVEKASMGARQGDLF